jgi:hypothetical protein
MNRGRRAGDSNAITSYRHRFDAGDHCSALPRGFFFALANKNKK